MAQEDERGRMGTPAENYPLIPSRSREITRILELLQESPIVFLWAPAENGKTGFARELRNKIPEARHILGVQLENPDFEVRKPFDEHFDDGQIVIVDEFILDSETKRTRINGMLKEGKRFVFMTHHPKSHYLKSKKYHKRQLPHMVGLIRDYPWAPWIYLSMWT